MARICKNGGIHPARIPKTGGKGLARIAKIGGKDLARISKIGGKDLARTFKNSVRTYGVKNIAPAHKNSQRFKNVLRTFKNI